MKPFLKLSELKEEMACVNWYLETTKLPKTYVILLFNYMPPRKDERDWSPTGVMANYDQSHEDEGGHSPLSTNYDALLQF